MVVSCALNIQLFQWVQWIGCFGAVYLYVEDGWRDFLGSTIEKIEYDNTNPIEV